MKKINTRIMSTGINVLLLNFFLTIMTLAYAEDSYNAYILGEVTLTINKKTNQYKTGESIALKEGDAISFQQGDGYVMIKGNEKTIVLFANHRKKEVILTTTQIAKLSGDLIDYPTTKMIRLFSKEGEKNGTRSTGKTYTNPIHIGQDNPGIEINTEKWIFSPSRLPITISILTSEKKSVESFTLTVDEDQQAPKILFIPKDVLKNGYYLKIENNRNFVIVDAVVILEPSNKSSILY